MGLLSPGGVHSHQDHMAAMANILTANGIRAHIHAFLDGRDTPPKSALEFLAKFEADLANPKLSSVATVTGRYYAMDRDKRWDRVELAYNAITSATADYRATSATEAVEQAYARDENDEFTMPTIIGDYAGIGEGDGLLMANFRADRAREILTALLDPAFDGFTRSDLPAFAATLGAVEYSTALSEFHPILFPSAGNQK